MTNRRNIVLEFTVSVSLLFLKQLRNVSHVYNMGFVRLEDF